MHLSYWKRKAQQLLPETINKEIQNGTSRKMNKCQVISNTETDLVAPPLSGMAGLLRHAIRDDAAGPRAGRRRAPRLQLRRGRLLRAPRRLRRPHQAGGRPRGALRAVRAARQGRRGKRQTRRPFNTHSYFAITNKGMRIQRRS